MLSVMPPIVMLLMERDDISDSLIWAGGISILGLILYSSSRRINKVKENEIKTMKQTIKVDKIE